jgi:hypothetical protein
MNITEAQAVSQLLRFVTDLTLFERGHDEDVDEARLPEHAAFLAGRVRRALGGAGIDPPADVKVRVEELLWLPEDDASNVEDVPVAGGRL